MNSIRKRLTYANVMSSFAVFLVLGGATAIAATHIPGNSVGAKQLQKAAVKTGKIKNEAVNAAKIANGNVTTAKIAEGNVTTSKIADGNVTNSKLAEGSVSSSKIADGSVTSSKLADGGVTNSKLANESVTGSKLKLSTLGTVPSAETAEIAELAESVGGSETFPLTRVTPTETFASEEEGLENAAPIEMFSAGPLEIYGECFISEGQTWGVTLIRTSEKEAIFYGNDDGAYGDTEYLEPNTPAEERELLKEDESSGASNLNNYYYSSFQAVAKDGTTITGFAQVEVSGGALPGDGGPFGPGESCLFYGTATNLTE